MDLFSIIDNSKSVQQFVKVERLSNDELYELFFECFCSYMETFRERLKYGREIKLILASYKEIKAFQTLSPRDLINTMFLNCRMHKWFAYRFWKEVDKQVGEDRICKDDLFVSLTFLNAIPTKTLMEEILNDTKNGAERRFSGTEKAARGKTRRIVEQA